MSAPETPCLRVERAGLLTTVQDLGRDGYGRFGLATAGTLDDYACRWANLLVGNEPGAAVLELTLLGPALVYEGAAPVVAALTGADCGATRNDEPLPRWRTIVLMPGDQLDLGACKSGARAYLAVAGGIAVPPALGSRATDQRAGLGGLAGRAVQAGDRLPLAPPATLPAESLALPAARVPRYDREIAVRVVLGPQDDRFTEDAIVTFLSSPYTVTRAADRMGLRLDGAPLTFHAGPAAADILSEGLATGAIQVPAHGQPIILLADHQTTGGYAKLATVSSADLWRLGQARPGDSIRFRAVPVAEAQAVARQYYAAFATSALERGNWNAERGTPAADRQPSVAEAVIPHSWTPAAVQAILDRVAALGLTEFTLDVPGVRLQLRRGAAPANPAPPVGQPAAPDTPAEQTGAGEFTVSAPFLGVFYRAAKAGEPPLVAPGDHVAPDQPLGLIEVMKTFHEVTAGRSARVLEILAADATPVEYGQPLFRLAAEERPGG
jgi:antagonist of KipI